MSTKQHTYCDVCGTDMTKQTENQHRGNYIKTLTIQETDSVGKEQDPETHKDICKDCSSAIRTTVAKRKNLHRNLASESLKS